ncbi:MAG: glyoxalase [Actinomycetia bacterium]|nr:glyoxalase [Actinomycetes bacterium]
MGFQQVNIVVSDLDASAAFYRLLGLELDAPAEDWPPGTGARHAGSDRVDLDNVPMARLWGDDGLAAGETVLGFSATTPEDVDRLYAELIAAGHKGRRQPHDAFFGARYAIVEDPDGHPIGLMGPRHPERSFTPG